MEGEPRPQGGAVPETSVAASGSERTAFEELLLGSLPLVERVVDFIGRRHGLTRSETEELSSVVKLKLVEDDYGILRRFRGRSSLPTYLTTVIHRISLDERIRRWGKWRPSAEAQRLGPVAVKLERLLVCDGLTFDEAFEALRTNHRIEESRDALRELSQKLPNRTTRRLVGEEIIATLASNGDAEESVLAREAERLSRRAEEALRSATTRLAPEDRLLLKMRFEDAFTVPEIASAFHLEAKPLYRRIELLLLELRKSLESGGLSASAVADLLGGSSVTIRVAFAPREGPGNAVRRPSKEA